MGRCCSPMLRQQALTKMVVLGKPSRAAACSLPRLGVWSLSRRTAAVWLFSLLGKRDFFFFNLFFSSAALSRLGMTLM